MERRLRSVGGLEWVPIGLELSFALRKILDMVKHSPRVDGLDSLSRSESSLDSGL